MHRPKRGDRISNYHLDEVIGSGSFGQVWRATHHVFDDVVAIKIPTDAQYVRNLQREGVTIHGLNHPNIVRAIDLDPYGDPPYLVMEYVAGDSLRAFIDAHGAMLPFQFARNVMLGVLSALEVAHAAGVIHRDIKPANILLNQTLDTVDGVTPQSVKVTDFGLGRVRGVTMHSVMQSGEAATGDAPLSGTFAYMSPEQLAGDEVDGRSDLYSCGVVLFEMLTGDRPHGLERPSSIRRDVPDDLDRAFEKCYTRRDRRFASAAEMAAFLRGGLDAASEQKPGALSAPKGLPVAGGAPESKERTARCPKCDKGVGDDDRYCIHCGARLSATVPAPPVVPVGSAVPTCWCCGRQVEQADRYCIFCGTDLRRAGFG